MELLADKVFAAVKNYIDQRLDGKGDMASTLKLIDQRLCEHDKAVQRVAALEGRTAALERRLK